jgi:O-antigen ligase
VVVSELRRTTLPAALVTAAVGVALVAPLPIAPRHVVVVAAFVATAAVVLAIQRARARRLPSAPAALSLAVALVLAYGALLVVNAGSRYNSGTLGLSHRTRPVAWLPAGTDRYAGSVAWLQMAAVLLAGLVLTDQARRAVVRTRLLWLMAGGGALIGALGALDRYGFGPVHFRQLPLSGTHFAVFEYHGNAAAFLNLTLPAALTLLWRSWTMIAPGRERAVKVGLAAAAAIGVLVGCATHVSKAGQLLTLVTIAGSLLAIRRAAPRSPGPRATRVRLLWVGAALATVLVTAVGVAGASDRWRELPSTVARDSGRVLTWRAAIDAWQRAPLAGNGPGAFKLLLPEVTRQQVPALFRHSVVQPYQRGEPTTIWMRVHNDPIETLVEWGPFGLACLLVVFLTPLVTGVRALARRATVDPVAAAGGIVALAVLGLHALVDFPLQVLPIQLTAATWGAIVLGSSAPTAATPTPR